MLMSKSITRRGALIVLEGCDRSGKTTQGALILKALKEKNVETKLIRFPDRTTQIGKMLDSYLSSSVEICDQSVHLLFSANRWEVSKQIEKDINNGITLIVDRYVYSGVAFTAAKGYCFEWCKSPDAGLPAPDVTLFLNISTEDASKRGDYGNERYEKIEFQEKVKEIYKKFEGPNWKTIEAAQSIEKVTQDMMDVIENVIEETKTSLQPLKRLW